MTEFLYFAYGSNMLKQRLCATIRCPSARALGTAIAEGWTLSFLKKSLDQSGKATLFHAVGSRQYGVLFAIPNEESNQLDNAEGSAYRRIEGFAVRNCETLVHARTYIAKTTVEGLKPYDWYLALLIAGAMQNELPKIVIDALRSYEYEFDPNPNRPTRLEALDALAAAGYSSPAIAIAS
jgi:gamma-glutamylcyclotransferase